MRTVTPTELAGLQDFTRWTDIQLDQGWFDKLADQTLSGVGTLTNICQQDHQIVASLTVRVGPDTCVHLDVCLPLSARDACLKIPRHQEVQFQGRLPSYRPQPRVPSHHYELREGQITP